jgi:hypothetical protein
MPKNIVMLHYAAPPVVGGVESVLGHQARLLADDGHFVQIVAGRGAQFDDRIPFIQLPLADSRHPDVLSVKAELDAGQVPDEFEQLTGPLSEIDPKPVETKPQILRGVHIDAERDVEG